MILWELNSSQIDNRSVGPTSGWERESRGLRDKLEVRDFESVNMRFCKEQKNGTIFGGESGIKQRFNIFSDGKNNIVLFENNSINWENIIQEVGGRFLEQCLYLSKRN